jgi:hypothetical protein
MHQERLFPTAEDYEADREAGDIRVHALDAMRKLRDIMNATHAEEQIIEESKIAELEELGDRLKALGGTDDSFVPYLEGDGRFTEKARKDPKIMARWIAHDVSKIVEGLRGAINVIGAKRMMQEFTDTEDIGNDASIGILSGDQVPKKLAEFFGSQQALSFYDLVLDVDANESENA